MEIGTIVVLCLIGSILVLVFVYLVVRFLSKGKACTSRGRIDGKVVVVTGGDTPVAIELVKELCKLGAERVILAVTDLELGHDVAVEVKGELNGNVAVEHCDMASLKSVRDFCSRILEQESRINILINHACVMWHPYRQTAEGHEYHWGVNHLSHFVMTQLLMPLLLRGAPDARIITLSSSLHKAGRIHWDDPNFAGTNAPSMSDVPGGESSRTKSSPLQRPTLNYSASEAFNQSKLANILFTRELARRLDGTGVNSYSVDPGVIPTGLGGHILQGLGCCGFLSVACCWLPWLKSTTLSIQTTLYCAIEPQLQDQSGLYYSDCKHVMTSEAGASLDDAYRLWEMTERIVGLSS